MTKNEHFEDRYAKGEIPWDLGRADSNLVELVDSRPVFPCRALDIGCGTGDSSVWLASKEFQVTGLDLSGIAIAMAREKVHKNGVDCAFIEADFLVSRIENRPFGFIFDRGCFHSLNSREEHSAFAENVAFHLEKGGLWFSLIASADAPQRDPGPPRLSVCQIAAAVEPFFEILSLASGHLDSNRPDPVRCWVCLMMRR